MRRHLALLLAFVVAVIAATATEASAQHRRKHGPRDKADAGAVDAGSADDAGSLDAGAVNAGDAGDDPAKTAAPTDVDAGALDAGTVYATCLEHIPPGAKRPVMTEALPPRGLSGYAVELRLVIAHGKGERVLPEGFHLQAGSDAAKELEKAGFVVPDAAGGAAPKVTTTAVDDRSATTVITIPLVALPPKPGRNLLALPPLPIAIARANNEYVTLCTQAHVIQIEDPIANELDPQVKPNPPGRQQREEWPLARTLAWVIPAAIALAIAVALLDRWWRRRPKVVPEAPRIPPWVTAMRELERIRRSNLLDEGRPGEHFDQVSDAVRSYLGARYGFETVSEGGGLETTTGEMLELLGRVRPPIVELSRIKEFLDDCDLVKFARFTPTSEHCLEALAKGELIVQRTVPVVQYGQAPAGAPAPPTPPPEVST